MIAGYCVDHADSGFDFETLGRPMVQRKADHPTHLAYRYPVRDLNPCYHLERALKPVRPVPSDARKCP